MLTYPDRLLYEKSKVLNHCKSPYDDGRVPTNDALLNCRVNKLVAFVSPSGKVPTQNPKMRPLELERKEGKWLTLKPGTLPVLLQN